MTDADKGIMGMNPLYFKSVPAHDRIHINPEIRIRILGHFWLRQS